MKSCLAQLSGIENLISAGASVASAAPRRARMRLIAPAASLESSPRPSCSNSSPDIKQVRLVNPFCWARAYAAQRDTVESDITIQEIRIAVNSERQATEKMGNQSRLLDRAINAGELLVVDHQEHTFTIRAFCP